MTSKCFSRHAGCPTRQVQQHGRGQSEWHASCDQSQTSHQPTGELQTMNGHATQYMMLIGTGSPCDSIQTALMMHCKPSNGQSSGDTHLQEQADDQVHGIQAYTATVRPTGRGLACEHNMTHTESQSVWQDACTTVAAFPPCMLPP